MCHAHSISFSGQPTGFIVQSPFRNESFIFFKVIRKKDNDVWEKLSEGEG